MKTVSLVNELAGAQRLSRTAGWELLLASLLFALGLFGLATVIFPLEGEPVLQTFVVVESAVFLIASGIPLLAERRRRVIDDRLRERGVIVRGTVVAVQEVRWGGYGLWLLRYAYPDPSGARHQALAYDVKQVRTRAGESGDVRYDPARPTRSMWLGSESDCE